jgi:hypothetical protein
MLQIYCDGPYPRPGESVIVASSSKGVTVKVPLPDMTNDAEYNYQAPLYAGMPIKVIIPESK